MHNVITKQPFSRSTSIRILFAYFLNLFDLICTTIWINLYGLSIEANPIGRKMYVNHLAIPVKVIMLGAIMIVLHILLKKEPKWSWVSWLILIVYGVLALYHIGIGVTILLI